MRLILTALFALCLCTPLFADPPDTVAPGITLAAAKEVLKEHGYEVDALKYGLAMAPSNANNKLEFCRIDPAMTLLIEFRATTGRVESLGIVIIPEEGPRSKLSQVFRNVLAITLEADGIYTLKMKRVVNRASLPK